MRPYFEAAVLVGPGAGVDKHDAGDGAPGGAAAGGGELREGAAPAVADEENLAGDERVDNGVEVVSHVGEGAGARVGVAGAHAGPIVGDNAHVGEFFGQQFIGFTPVKAVGPQPSIEHY